MEYNINNPKYDQQPPRYNPSAEGSLSVDQKVTAVMKQVYLKMTLGVLVTAIVALLCSQSDGYVEFMINHSWMQWVYIIAWFGLGLVIPASINKLSNGVATMLFYLFSVITGLMLFWILLAYTEASVVKTLFITAGTFGAMTVYGYTTNRDLSKMGSILMMCLFGLIIVSVVNIFLKSSGLEWIISFVGVAIFIGLTAWDTQQIKNMAVVAPNEFTGRLATIGALNLYLDFVNLFLYLLRFFGSSRN